MECDAMAMQRTSCAVLVAAPSASTAAAEDGEGGGGGGDSDGDGRCLWPELIIGSDVTYVSKDWPKVRSRASNASSSRSSSRSSALRRFLIGASGAPSPTSTIWRTLPPHRCIAPRARSARYNYRAPPLVVARLSRGVQGDSACGCRPRSERHPPSRTSCADGPLPLSAAPHAHARIARARHARSLDFAPVTTCVCTHAPASSRRRWCLPDDDPEAHRDAPPAPPRRGSGRRRCRGR